MNISFVNIHLLNTYLINEIEGIAESDNLETKINTLIQVMQQHEGLLNGEVCQPEAVVQFLKSARALRKLTEHAQGFAVSDDLVKVTRAARSVFSHPGKLHEVYLQSLADWIAEEKIKTDELDLSNEEWLELAPYLTFLEYVGRSNFDTDEFIGDLLEKTEKLAELRIVNSDMTGKAFDRYKNTDHLISLRMNDCFYFNHPLPKGMSRLEHLVIEKCFYFNQPLPDGLVALKTLNIDCLGFNQPLPDGMISLQELAYPISSPLPMNNLIRFLLPIYRIDKERAITLAEGLGRIEAQLKFYELFVSRYPDRLDDIVTWVANLKHGEPLGIFREDNDLDISIIHDDLLKDDPYQQLLILYIIQYIIIEEDLVDVLDFLRPLIKTPMDDALLKFYEKMIVENISIDHVQREKAATLLFDSNREKKLKVLPYLFNETSLETIFRNIQNLEKTELFDDFTQTFSQGLVRHALRTKDCLTENRDDNLKTMQELAFYVEEFNKYLKTHLEDDFPEFLKNAHALFQTTSGLVFLKTCLRDVVKIPQLQEAALRALPPVNSETIGLYPQRMDFEGGTLKIEAVPTLPMASSYSYIMRIGRAFSSREINQTKIYYYGTPAIDASGPGRQFFSEVIQGAVVNNRTKFTRTTGGGMAPYDPTHSDNHGNSHYYRSLGSFFSLALHLQYPIGKVFSEKVISCLCSFPTEALNNRNFDIAKFLSDMKPAGLIQYMKESTIEDEALVKLYEKVLLASSDVEILQAAQYLNYLLEDDKLQDLINGGVQNILRIQECVRDIIIEGSSYYLYAVYTMAQGINQRLPSSIGERAIHGWEDVRSLGAAELSRHLQGELTAQHIGDYLRIRIVGIETPEKVLAAENVKIWTEKWIDEKAENPEILANFVQAFSGGRALTREIRFDIDPNVHQVKTHTCFNSADIPINITEGWLRAVFDEFATGNLGFDME